MITQGEHRIRNHYSVKLNVEVVGITKGIPHDCTRFDRDKNDR